MPILLDPPIEVIGIKKEKVNFLEWAAAEWNSFFMRISRGKPRILTIGVCDCLELQADEYGFKNTAVEMKPAWLTVRDYSPQLSRRGKARLFCQNGEKAWKYSLHMMKKAAGQKPIVGLRYEWGNGAKRVDLYIETTRKMESCILPAEATGISISNTRGLRHRFPRTELAAYLRGRESVQCHS